MLTSQFHFEPPYYAVIFMAQLKSRSREYSETAAELKNLASKIPGYLGMESVEQDDGSEITVSYWKTKEAIREWREHKGHRQAQEKARLEWYEQYQVHIAKVESTYSFDSQRQESSQE